ncbi:MAG: MaoC family dehydratase [Nitrospinae bacterium]|nr:MaoC family dehydratase [Nitrospinota bacterium]
MEEKYFEDFRVGEKIHTKEKTLSAEEIIEFAELYDPQPFHIDEIAAAESPYGGIIASGFHTIGTSFRLFIDTGVIGTTGMGSPGMDSIRWVKPVRPGDTLRVEAEVIETRASRSEPERGIVLMDFKTFNQDNELVLSIRSVNLVRRRNNGSI